MSAVYRERGRSVSWSTTSHTSLVQGEYSVAILAQVLARVLHEEERLVQVGEDLGPRGGGLNMSSNINGMLGFLTQFRETNGTPEDLESYEDELLGDEAQRDLDRQEEHGEVDEVLADQVGHDLEEDPQVLDRAQFPVHEPEQVPDRQHVKLHADHQLVGVDNDVGGLGGLGVVRGHHQLGVHLPVRHEGHEGATLETCKTGRLHVHLMLQFLTLQERAARRFPLAGVCPNASRHDYLGEGIGGSNPQQSVENCARSDWPAMC